jgi:hypothetical protein
VRHTAAFRLKTTGAGEFSMQLGFRDRDSYLLRVLLIGGAVRL